MRELITISIILVVLFACNSQKEYAVENGTFKGKLPCEFCDNIETVLILNNDQTYILKQTKVNDNEKEILTDIKGNFVIKEKEPKSKTEFKLGMLILIENAKSIMKFKIITKRKLEILDMNEKEIDKVKDFTLDKVN